MKSNLFNILRPAVIMIMAGCLILQGCKQATLEDQLKTLISETNEKCPFPVDMDTRLDSMSAYNGNQLQYNYTLLNVDKNTVNLDPLLSQIKQQLIGSVKVDPSLEYLREQNTMFIYSYRDKNGSFLLKIPLKAEEYK